MGACTSAVDHCGRTLKKIPLYPLPSLNSFFLKQWCFKKGPSRIWTDRKRAYDRVNYKASFHSRLADAPRKLHKFDSTQQPKLHENR